MNLPVDRPACRPVSFGRLRVASLIQHSDTHAPHAHLRRLPIERGYFHHEVAWPCGTGLRIATTLVRKHVPPVLNPSGPRYSVTDNRPPGMTFVGIPFACPRPAHRCFCMSRAWGLAAASSSRSSSGPWRRARSRIPPSRRPSRGSSIPSRPTTRRPSRSTFRGLLRRALRHRRAPSRPRSRRRPIEARIFPS